MPNTFLTPSVIAQEALMILRRNLLFGSLVHRDHESEFSGKKVGESVSIRGPASFEAKEFTTSIVVQDAGEYSVNLTLEKHFDVSFAVTAKELALSISQFSTQLLNPAVIALAQGVDEYIAKLYASVYNFTGAPGDPPDSLTDMAAVKRKLSQMLVPNRGRVTVLDPVAEADIASLDAVISAEKRGDDGTALREGSIGRIMGIDWMMDQNVQAHTAGTWIGQSPTINGAVAEGATTAVLAACGASKTIKKGDLFTVAGAAGQYVVTADATSDGSGAAVISFSPAAPAGGFADTAALTQVASHTANLAFHRNAIALAFATLELPPSEWAQRISFEGLSIRMVRGYDITTKKDTISLDLLCGAKVIDPRLITRVLG